MLHALTPGVLPNFLGEFGVSAVLPPSSTQTCVKDIIVAISQVLLDSNTKSILSVKTSSHNIPLIFQYSALVRNRIATIFIWFFIAYQPI